MVASSIELVGSLLMLLTTATALLISLIYLILILVSQGRQVSVSSLLASNTFLAALVYSSAHFAIAVGIFRSDLAVKNGCRIQFHNPFCVSTACLFYAGCSLLYFAYVMEAIQRFSRVVLYDYRWLHKRRVQLLLIFAQWFVCLFVTCVPLMATNELQYDITMNMCIIPITSSGWTMYFAVFCYAIPLLLVAFFYHRLIEYILRARSRVSACLISGSVVVSAQRQLALIQRVIVLITILIVSGLPYCIFITIGFWTDPPEYQFRISFLCVDIALMSVVLAMFCYSRDMARFRRC